MTLHDKYVDIQALPLPPWKIEAIEKELSVVKLNISELIEDDQDQAEKILKIYNIYSTNSFEGGLKIKTSRFNHSCQPNASSIFMNNGQYEVRAISKIKAGEEITICYTTGYFGLRKRLKRQAFLAMGWFFICSCNICETAAGDDDKNELEELVEEVKKLGENRHDAFKMGLAYVPFRFFTST